MCYTVLIVNKIVYTYTIVIIIVVYNTIVHQTNINRLNNIHVHRLYH